MTAGHRVPRAPWQPSDEQAPLVAALVGPRELRAERLRAWSEAVGTIAPAPSVVELLPLAARPLQEAVPDAPVARLAFRLFEETAARNLQRVSRLLRTLARLDAAGIPAVALKGVALALGHYRSFGARPMLDADILVQRSDVARAVAVLREAGCRTTGDEADDRLAQRMRVVHALAMVDAGGEGLDLHWRLLTTPTLESGDGLWRRVKRIEVGDAVVRILSAADLAFQVCLHAIQPSWTPSPRWMIDLASIEALHTDDGATWDEVASHAVRTGHAARLLAAVREYQRHAAVGCPDAVHARLAQAVSSRERRELEVFARMPPYGRADVARWHWHRFRRLREHDESWRHMPRLVGLAQYVQIKRRLRAVSGEG